MDRCLRGIGARRHLSHSPLPRTPHKPPTPPTPPGLAPLSRPQVSTIVGADVSALKAILKRQAMPALLRALSGERVVGALVAAYLAWSYLESRGDRAAMA